MSLSWSPDPDRVILPGNPPVEVRDAYSHWIFGPGRDFLPAERMPRIHPADFSYYVVSNVRRPVSGPHPSEGFDQTELAAFEASAGTAKHRSRHLTSPLPIRASAVPDHWTRPAGVGTPDPEIEPDKLVIAGVIDDGVNVFHQRFQSADGASRIDYAWIQDADAPETTAVPFGRELTGPDIAAARATGKAEIALMRRFGLIPGLDCSYMPSTLVTGTSHGTQITDLVAGADPSEIGARNTRLITVQFPSMSVLDTSGASLISAVQLAATYVFDRALLLSRRYGLPIPVVLNLSFGLTGGSRTGGHFLERTLRAQAMRYRMACQKRFGRPAPSARVVPAGNRALSRAHAASLKREPGKLDFDLLIQPDDQSPSYVEIWLPKGARHATVTISTPGGDPVSLDFPDLDERDPGRAERAFVLHRDGTGPLLGRLSLDAPLDHAAGQDTDGQPWWRLLLALGPSRHIPAPTRKIPFGAWKIAVRTQGETGPIHAWVQRDEDVSGLSVGARQPYLDDPRADAEAFDAWSDVAVDDPVGRTSAIARNGALSGLATNAPLTRRTGDDHDLDGPQMDTVSVGAVRWDTGVAALYTGANLDLDVHSGRGHQSPSVMGVAETSRVLPHIRAAGTLSGGGAGLNGTSAAAAVVSRQLVDVLRALDPADYAGFVPLQAISGTPPPADGDGPDLASSPRIRAERLREGGLLADLPGSLEPQVIRGVRRKTGP